MISLQSSDRKLNYDLMVQHLTIYVHFRTSVPSFSLTYISCIAISILYTFILLIDYHFVYICDGAGHRIALGYLSAFLAWL